MNAPKKKQVNFSLYLSYGVLGLLFIVDCFVPFGIFGGIPYVIGLIVLMWILKPNDVLWFSITCGALTILAFLLGEDHSDMSGLMNRFMAIFTMAAIAMLIKRHNESEASMKEQQRHLNSVVDKRTEGLKQVVDQLEEMKIRIAESEELGHFGFWEFYPANQRMVWSNGVFAIYGFPITPQAPSMQEFLDQCHTDDAQTLQRSIQYGLSEKKQYTVEYRVIMPDGGVKWIFNRGRPIVNKAGEVEMLVGTIQDITSQKHSQESVQANRARYTTLFRSAAVGKVLMIPNKRILEANIAFSKWIGYSEKSLLKVPLEKLIHEDDRSMDNAYAREMISGEIEFYQKEKRFIRRDGTVLWGLFSVAPVFDAEDKISCFAVEIIDITGHKNLQMALKKAQESWHEAEEALTESEASRRMAENLLQEKESELAAVKSTVSSVSDGVPAQAANFITPPAVDAPLMETPADALGLAPSREPSSDISDVLPPRMDPVEPPHVSDAIPEPGAEVTARIPEPPTVEPEVSLDDTLPLSQESDDTVAADVDSVLLGNGVVPPSPAPAGKPLSEEAIGNLFDGNSDMMAVIGMDGCYQRVSSSLTRELGYEDGELDQQHFLNFIHQDDRSFVHDQFYNLQKGTRISRLQLRHLSKFDGFRRFLWDASVSKEHEVIYSVLKPNLDFDEFASPAAPQSPVVAEPEESLPEVVAEPVAELPVEEPVIETPAEMPAVETPAVQEPLPEIEPELILSSEPAPPVEEIPLAPPVQPEPLPEITPDPEPIVYSEPVRAVPEPIEVPETIAEPVLKTSHEVNASAPDPAPEPARGIVTEAPARKPASAKQVDWRRLTDRMPFQIWTLSLDKSCRYVNKKVRDYTGLPFEQLEGKGWSKAVHPEDYRTYLKYYTEVFEKQEPMGCQYRLRRNDGTYRWMQESSVPLHSNSGTFEGYLVTCMDISSLQSLDKKFKHAFESAVNLVDLKSAMYPCKKDDSKHIFTDSVKIADALIANASEVPNVDLSRLMEFAGRRLLGKVFDIIAFADVDITAHKLLKRSIALEDIISSTIEMLVPLKRGDGVRFQPKYHDGPIRVKVDKVLGHRVFEVMLRNLIDWAESRVITLDVMQKGNQGVVEIKHIGPGFELDYLSRIDNIYRSDASTQFQRKTGLEVALVKRLTEAMDGELIIRDSADAGPMVEIRFELAEVVETEESVPVVEEALVGETPAEPAQVKQLAEVVEAIASLEAPPPPRVPEKVTVTDEEEILIHENGTNGQAIARHRVLVGETNSETQRLVRSLLQPYYDLTIAPNTDDLLKRAEESQFDLLLLDVHLKGGRSGVDVLRELRRRPQYTRTPAIAVAANTSAIDQRELIDRAGFDGFLRKPFSIVELLETVERMIET